MGNEQKDKGPVVQPPTPAEIKTFIMIAQTKLSLFRNKKIDIIKKKKLEIAKCLKENNLDVAKAKMDSLIREEDAITSYDILGPLLEILKERVTYIISSSECPPDLRAQLDSVIYASIRLDLEELMKLRDLILRKYGSAYIQKAENNVDKLVNINLVEKLKIKPASDAFLIIRLKQLCKEKKIPFEFPEDVITDIPGGIGNPFGQPGNNPYGGDINPYASAQGGNPYGPPQGGDNPYGPPQGGNNSNPYGPPQGGDNPFGPPQGGNNANPYGPPQGGENPFGPPQGGDNSNPFGGPTLDSQMGGNNMNNNMNNNPYGSVNNQNNNQDNIFGNTLMNDTQLKSPNLNNNEPPKSDNPYESNINNNNNPFENKSGDNGFPGPDNLGGNPYQ